LYVRHHNPFTYFSDVLNSSVEKLNLVPFTQFATDLNNNQLPSLSFVIPNLDNDAHNGTLAQADSWLNANIAPLLNSPAFQQDGLLIVLFDEAATSDTTHGGGRVAAVVVGPNVKKGFSSNALYQHQNLLRTIMDALGMNTYPGAAATAADMGEVFTGAAPAPTPTPAPSPTPTPTTPGCSTNVVGVMVCSPTPSETVQAGQSATYTLQIRSQNQLLNSLPQLSCSGLPSGAACSFGPVTPASGTLDQTTTVTISTTPPQTAALQLKNAPLLASLLPVFGLLLAGRPSRRKRRWFASCASVATLLLAIGCGGGGSRAPAVTTISGTPAGTYTVIVKAVGPAFTSSTPLTLVVR
jgi:hypothetical protein